MKKLIVILTIILSVSLSACQRHTDYPCAMQQAETLMKVRPDSCHVALKKHKGESKNSHPLVDFKKIHYLAKDKKRKEGASCIIILFLCLSREQVCDWNIFHQLIL